MSLLNQHWNTPKDGITTGRAPAQIRVMNDAILTRPQYANVAHAYKLFTDAVRVTTCQFLIQNRVFSDGTKVRMVSNHGVDTVMVWPTGGIGKPGKNPPFFCIPFDESYRITPKQDTYIMRSFSPAKDGKPPVLGKLEKSANCSFIPKIKDEEGAYQFSTLSHPGNQTWFANAVDQDGNKHESAGLVLSWWGQPNRYAQSPFDVTLTTGQITAPYIIGGDGYPRGKINGWTDTLDGEFSNATLAPADNGKQKTVPPFTTKGTPFVFGQTSGEVVAQFGGSPYSSNPYGYIYNASEYAHPFAASNSLKGNDAPAVNAAHNAIWVNAVRFNTNFGVWSACIGKRGETRVVRMFHQVDRHVFAVREKPLSYFTENMPAGGTFTAASCTNTVLELPPIDGIQFQAYDFSELRIDYIVHPFYWNADGSEAMGLFAFSRGYPSDTDEFPGIALFKLVVKEVGFELTLMETTTFSSIGTQSVTPTQYDSSIIGTRNGSSSANCLSQYGYILAADYEGNSPLILRAGFSENFASSATETNVRTASSSSTGNGGGTGSSTYPVGVNPAPEGSRSSGGTYNHTRSGGSSVTVSSWVTLNGEAIPELSDTYFAYSSNTGFATEQDSSQTDMTFVIVDLPYNDGSGTSIVPHYRTTYTSSSSYTHESGGTSASEATGHASLWGISGGDMRGGNVVLREAPIRSGSGDTWSNKSAILGSSSTSDVYGFNAFGVGGSDTSISSQTLSTSGGPDSATYSPSAKSGRFVKVNVRSMVATVLKRLTHRVFHEFGTVENIAPFSRTREGSSTPGVGPNQGLSDPPPLGGTKLTNVLGVVVGALSFPVALGTASVPRTGANVTTDYTRRALTKPFSKIDGGYYPLGTANYGAGAPSDIVFSSGAVSPDGKLQYIGLVSVSLLPAGTTSFSGMVTPPVIPADHFKLDQWYSAGAPIEPSDPYPYTGEFKMLSCPVFAGAPFPTT